MSDEIESPVEHLSEELHHAAEEAKESWLKWSALLSALFAVLAAISGLQSSHYSDSAMIKQIQASDQWSYYQAKGIKAILIESQEQTLQALAKKPLDLTKRHERYLAEQEEAKISAEKFQKIAEAHLETHEIFSKAVTLFQVAIAVIAITVLTKRRGFLLLAAALGCAGGFFLAYGFISASANLL